MSVDTAEEDRELAAYRDRVRRKSTNWRVVGTAAAVLVVLGVVSSYTRMERIENGTSVESQVTLPDRSTIRLAPGSRIKYPKGFSQTAIRRIELKGEAVFTAQRTGGDIYFVKTSVAEIAVHGKGIAVFSVQALHDVTTVQALEGTVTVFPQEGSVAWATLTAGQRARATRSEVVRMAP